jgi:uncharacterized protein YjcR
MKSEMLTCVRVDQIRAMYRPGEVGYKTLAKKLGVSVETIKSVVHDKTWKDSFRVLVSRQ